ncbi:hypothetical protein ACFQVA_41970 [Actinomadura keratinilytica]
MWEQAGLGLTAALGQAELARLRRGGVGVLTSGQALAVLDAALESASASQWAHVVPVRLELAGLRRRPEEVPRCCGTWCVLRVAVPVPVPGRSRDWGSGSPGCRRRISSLS